MIVLSLINAYATLEIIFSLSTRVFLCNPWQKGLKMVIFKCNFFYQP